MTTLRELIDETRLEFDEGLGEDEAELTDLLAQQDELLDELDELLDAAGFEVEGDDGTLPVKEYLAVVGTWLEDELSEGLGSKVKAGMKWVFGKLVKLGGKIAQAHHGAVAAHYQKKAAVASARAAHHQAKAAPPKPAAPPASRPKPKARPKRKMAAGPKKKLKRKTKPAVVKKKAPAHLRTNKKPIPSHGSTTL